MEIERKYLISKLPDNLENYHSKKIEQGYLCNDPIIRIRKSNEDYYMTYKSKQGLKQDPKGAIINQEVELMLTKSAYELLKTKIEDHMVYKTRYLIPIKDGLTAELDVFEEQLSGLVFVEVEFPDEETANSFLPPAWFGKEVSEDRRFSNYHLSKLHSIQDLTLR